jgi:hypothetical protein
MSTFKNKFVGSLFLLISLNSFSQTVNNRSVNPIMNPTEGLTASREDVNSKYSNKKIKNADTVSVYIFAVSFSFMDSTLFISNIQKVDDAVVYNNTFLAGITSYEQQFGNYVEQLGNNSQIPVVYFSKREKAIQKRYKTAARRSSKKLKLGITEVGNGFSFSTPL